MYGVDPDLCIRARKLGATPHITPAATIIHYSGSSDHIRADRMVKLMSGKISVIQRHFSGLRKPLALGVLRLWPYTRMLALTLLASVSCDLRFQSGRDNWTEIWRRRVIAMRRIAARSAEGRGG
jgi:N-acetylglucosaminyl-diphospho-decaprenol L-rhamnosyltransferase